MNYNLLILPLAEQDIREINFQYNLINNTLAKKFNSALKKEVAIIHKNPNLYQVRYDSLRMAKIDKFPYVIHFEIYSEIIVINAIYHTSRDSEIWLSRD
jgi:plasmid stabilization system protein ParE